MLKRATDKQKEIVAHTKTPDHKKGKVCCLTLSFWQHQIQENHGKDLPCISALRATGVLDCYKLLEDMPHLNHPCVDPKEQ